MSTSEHQSTSSYIGKTYVDDRASGSSSSSSSSEEDTRENIVRHSELPEGSRVIGPDTMVTMDFREDRFNLEIDENNKVTGTRHG
jgi:hypothetical protein